MNPILNRLFPKECVNNYDGRPLARWVFILITLVTLARSLVHIWAPDGGAQSIATLPLDRYTQGGAETVVMIFALWGLSQLLIGLIYLVVLWCYSGLIPLMYLTLVVEYGARIIIGLLKPAEFTGTAPGGVGNFILLPLAVVMLVLSLRSNHG